MTAMTPAKALLIAAISDPGISIPSPLRPTTTTLNIRPKAPTTRLVGRLKIMTSPQPPDRSPEWFQERDRSSVPRIPVDQWARAAVRLARSCRLLCGLDRDASPDPNVLADELSGCDQRDLG